MRDPKIDEELIQAFVSRNEIPITKITNKINDNFTKSVNHIRKIDAFRKNQEELINFINSIDAEASKKNKKVSPECVKKLDYSHIIKKLSELESSIDKIQITGSSSGGGSIDFFNFGGAGKSPAGKSIFSQAAKKVLPVIAIGAGAYFGYKYFTNSSKNSAESVDGVPSSYKPTSFSDVMNAGTSSYVPADFKQDKEFSNELNRVAKKFNIDANDLLGVMSSEAGPSLSPAAKNPNGTATGLIQFTQTTARGLGTSVEELRGMSRAQQMKYVEKYFDSWKLPKGATGAQIKAYVLLPGRANRDPITTRGENYYTQNAGLDSDQDGTISYKDLDLVVQKGRRNLGLPATTERSLWEKATNKVFNAGSAFYNMAITERQTVSPIDVRKISSGYGYRTDPVHGNHKFHEGVDVKAAIGTKIYSIMDGKILKAGYEGDAGNLIKIDHGRGVVSKYMHLSEIDVKVGELVKKGSMIGLTGNSGKSTGPHLHFQVDVNGHPVDPSMYLNAVAAPYSPKKGKMLTQSELETRWNKSFSNKKTPSLMAKSNPKPKPHAGSTTKGGSTKNPNPSNGYRKYFT